MNFFGLSEFRSKKIFSFRLESSLISNKFSVETLLEKIGLIDTQKFQSETGTNSIVKAILAFPICQESDARYKTLILLFTYVFTRKKLSTETVMEKFKPAKWKKNDFKFQKVRIISVFLHFRTIKIQTQRKKV